MAEPLEMSNTDLPKAVPAHTKSGAAAGLRLLLVLAIAVALGAMLNAR
jgi:hypothetical protein